MPNHPIRRYTNEINYVPAKKPLARRIMPAEVQIIEQGALTKPGHSPLKPELLPQIQPAFAAQEIVRETTNGKERAVATVIRMAPMTGIFAILATGLAFALRLSLGQTLVIFAIVTGVTYYWFNRTDYEHSAAGVAPRGHPHRIDRATELAQTKMGYDNQLRRELAQAYLQHLERAERAPEDD
jgi:hypothetical protein